MSEHLRQRFGSRRTLYRTLGAAVILFLLAASASSGWAQFRKKREAHRLRAIGVLMWPSSGKGAPTLAPLVILTDGQYYDASAYLASPVPLAAQPGTVYEGQHSGLAIGLFTVHSARELNHNWLALGNWHEGIETPKPVTLGRSRGRADSPDDDRPVLRRPAASSAPSPKTSTPLPASAPPPSQPSAPPAAVPAPPEEASQDTDRPVLRRGKPAGGVSEDIPAEIAKATKSTPMPASGKPAAAAAPAPKIMVAISDVQAGEERSYLLTWSAQEQSQLTQKTVALAQQEIAKWSAFRQQKRGDWPLEDVQVKIFDLSLDNYPEVVLSARQPVATDAGKPGARRTPQKAAAAPAPPPADVYVTVVARSDLDGNLRTLFSSVTDARHLDASPRLELIDAVDADGEGYGELLFHKVFGASSPLEGNVVLYRVGPDRLVELFDSSGQ